MFVVWGTWHKLVEDVEWYQGDAKRGSLDFLHMNYGRLVIDSTFTMQNDDHDVIRISKDTAHKGTAQVHPDA